MALTRRQFIVGASALTLAPTKIFAQPKSKTLRVVFFSDTHVALNRNVNECAKMLGEIVELKPNLVINGGDVTDYGWRGEYSNYRAITQGLPFKIHHVPGNHDVRWSPFGPQIYKEFVDQPFSVFEREGVWFVLLDSTVPLSHWGHYEAVQLEWLREKLSGIGPLAPVVVCTHHWVGRDSLMVDNEMTLRALFRNSNVVLWLNGHGHQDIEWKTDGIPSIMNKGLYQLSYSVLDFDLSQETLVVKRRSVENPQSKTIVSQSLKPRSAVVLPDFVGPFDTELFTHVRLDRGNWTPSADWKLPSLISGTHTLQYRLKESGTEIEFPMFEQRTNSALVPLADRTLPGGVMSHLRAEDDGLFVSQMDGSVMKLDRRTLRTLWHSKTEGYCHSTPLVTDKMVIVGSADGHLYAYGRRNGVQVWRKKLGFPVYSSATVAGSRLFLAGAGAFFCLNVETGETIWKTPIPESNTAFAQSVACTDGERFYAGCWDSAMVALDVETGEVVWRELCQPKTFAFSPAISSPCLHQDSVFVAANGNGLFRFECSTGRKHWEIESPGEKYGHSSPAVTREGHIIVGCLGDKGQVRCVDMAGKELWMVETGATIYDSSPFVDGSHAFIGSVDGTLSMINTASGKLVDQYRVGTGHLLSTPVAKDGVVYACGLDGRMVALRYA